MDYVIVIPSHKRFKLIKQTTLKLLDKHNIKKKIYIFVSNESYNKYLELLPLFNNLDITIVKSQNSILKTRNHIIEYFPEEQKIVEIDDDVQDIETTKKGEKNKSITDLNKLIEESFNIVKKGIWGINSTTNNYYAKGDNVLGLYSIVASFYGYTNDKRIKLTLEEKEDFEKVIQFFELKLPILKRRGFGTKTKYWKNPGGIQAHYGETTRIKVQRAAAQKLYNKYPNYCYIRERKNGIFDIRFRNKKF